MKIIINLIAVILLTNIQVNAAEVTLQETEKEISGYTQEDMNAAAADLLDNLNINQIDEMVTELLGEAELSFSEFIMKLISGEVQLDIEYLLRFLQEIFVFELSEQKEILIQLVLLLVISALLIHLSHLFEKGQMSQITFYMVYLMVFVLLMKSFQGLLSIAESVVNSIASFMKVLTPAYFLAITASDGAITAGGYYQMVLFVITLIEFVFLRIGIPGIQMYIVFGVVNYLSSEDYLSKLAELIKTIVIWMSKTATTVVVGLQVIQKMVSPALDMVKRGVVGKTASAIPGIGNVLDSVTEMAIGCAILVRNCMGAAALIVMVVFGLGPIIQIGITTLLYRLVSALCQPFSDKRLIKAISVVGDGCALLLRVTVTIEILFLLTVAIVAVGGVM